MILRSFSIIVCSIFCITLLFTKPLPLMGIIFTLERKFLLDLMIVKMLLLQN
jgi:hypothetical protein